MGTKQGRPSLALRLEETPCPAQRPQTPALKVRPLRRRFCLPISPTSRKIPAQRCNRLLTLLRAPTRVRAPCLERWGSRAPSRRRAPQIRIVSRKGSNRLRSFTYRRGVLAGRLVFGETVRGDLRWRSSRSRRSRARQLAARTPNAGRDHLIAPERRVEKSQRPIDRCLVCCGARNVRGTYRNGGVAGWRTFSEEVVVADARSTVSFAPGMSAAATSPLVAGGATLSASPRRIATGSRMRLRLSGSRLCTMPGPSRTRLFTPWMLRSSLAWASSAAPAGCAKNASASEREY